MYTCAFWIGCNEDDSIYVSHMLKSPTMVAQLVVFGQRAEHEPPRTSFEMQQMHVATLARSCLQTLQQAVAHRLLTACRMAGEEEMVLEEALGCQGHRLSCTAPHLHQ